MSGTVLDMDNILSKDMIACEIADKWHTWNMFKQAKIGEWTEVRKYIFATDTTQTTNNNSPWKNKTTLPKITQIRDTLFANYRATLFPKQNYVNWEGVGPDDQNKDKVNSIKNYTRYLLGSAQVEREWDKILYDYIDYGNAFFIAEWKDLRRQSKDSGVKEGFVGTIPKRISPLDIVFNPVADSFEESPKIIRTLWTRGELKKNLNKLSNGTNQDLIEELYHYLVDLRKNVSQFTGTYTDVKDDYLRADGFFSFKEYLDSDYVEVLTFYGDFYDRENDVLHENQVISIIDRHKVISQQDNPTTFSNYPIFHIGWRIRQDNLWAMGPLENLVGLQYRLDHVENLKSDLMDIVGVPPLKIKGQVDDFEWGPMARINVGDDGDVEMLIPDTQVFQYNTELEIVENRMELFAGSPKEAAGFRTPGEKTAYEVQRIENAAARIFGTKTVQFERFGIEPYLNAALDFAQRYMDQMQLRIFDDELKITVFQTLTKADIMGTGTIRPVAARNFAERAEKIQNISNFYASGAGQDPSIKMHFSGVKLAKLFERLLDLDDDEVVLPYVAISEQAEAQKLANNQEEQVAMETAEPAGIAPDDTNQPFTS